MSTIRRIHTIVTYSCTTPTWYLQLCSLWSSLNNSGRNGPNRFLGLNRHSFPKRSPSHLTLLIWSRPSLARSSDSWNSGPQISLWPPTSGDFLLTSASGCILVDRCYFNGWAALDRRSRCTTMHRKKAYHICKLFGLPKTAKQASRAVGVLAIL